MAQISHLIRIRARPEEVFQRVATTDCIAEWFTEAASPDDRQGSSLESLQPRFDRLACW